MDNEDHPDTLGGVVRSDAHRIKYAIKENNRGCLILWGLKSTLPRGLLDAVPTKEGSQWQEEQRVCFSNMCTLPSSRFARPEAFQPAWKSPVELDTSCRPTPLL